MTGLRRIAESGAYWGWRLASAAAQRLPSRVAYAFAVAGGELAYRAWAPKRRAAIANLAPVLGRTPDDPAVAETARRSFRNFARYLVEIMRFPTTTAEEVTRRVTIDDDTWRHLRDARAAGKGVIFVSLHYGNFELGGARVAQEFPLTVIADDLGNARLMALLAGNRQHKGITLQTPDGAAKKALRALRRNELVGLMMDLGPRALAFTHIDVPFCGRRTTFPTVAAELARVSGAAIVVAVSRREAGETFRGVAEPPIHVPRTADAAADIRAATEAIVRGLERFVREHPDQWYIFRPMWPEARA